MTLQTYMPWCIHTQIDISIIYIHIYTYIYICIYICIYIYCERDMMHAHRGYFIRKESTRVRSDVACEKKMSIQYVTWLICKHMTRPIHIKGDPYESSAHAWGATLHVKTRTYLHTWHDSFLNMARPTHIKGDPYESIYMHACLCTHNANEPWHVYVFINVFIHVMAHGYSTKKKSTKSSTRNTTMGWLIMSHDMYTYIIMSHDMYT